MRTKLYIRRIVFVFLLFLIIVYVSFALLHLVQVKKSVDESLHAPHPLLPAQPRRSRLHKRRIRSERKQSVIRHPNNASSVFHPINHVPDGMTSLKSIWFDPNNRDDDRVLAQLEFLERTELRKLRKAKSKIIFLNNGLGELQKGRKIFELDNCPVDNCYLTADSRYSERAHARLFQGDAYFQRRPTKPADQIWILSLLESPINTPNFLHLQGLINWTTTYRTDSTIVTPYAKFNLSLTSFDNSLMPTNYAENKTKLVAWFVSNCLASNKRREFANELRRYVPVDVFGECGGLSCPREERERCNSMLSRRYKFYLAFENSNCKDYITEKFFANALMNQVVPIVMGASKGDYLRIAPPNSFLHVDDFRDAGHLADHLLTLDADDAAYNAFFAWRSKGAFVSTRYWCRLCAMLHHAHQHVTWYENVNEWWRGAGVCVGNDNAS